MTAQYVFVVGLPRTGSKLMVNTLKNSQEKHCYITRENFYLGRFLRPGVRHQMRKFGDLSIDANVYKLVDYMYSGKFSVFAGDYWSSLADGSLDLDKETLLQRILNSDRSDKEIYRCLLQFDTSDEAILGDKTGPHLYRVPVLIGWFPDAKIIHTFRDPRAVLASEQKRRLQRVQRQIRKSKKAGHKFRPLLLKLTEPFVSMIVILYITIAWLWAVKLHYKYSKVYPNNYYLSKFEDLVEEPEKNVRELCDFLEMEFHPAMLAPPQISSSFSSKGGTGFNKQTLNKWQRYLKPWTKAWVWLWGRKHLREFGYIH